MDTKSVSLGGTYLNFQCRSDYFKIVNLSNSLAGQALVSWQEEPKHKIHSPREK